MTVLHKHSPKTSSWSDEMSKNGRGLLVAVRQVRNSFGVTMQPTESGMWRTAAQFKAGDAGANPSESTRPKFEDLGIVCCKAWVVKLR